MGIFGKEKKPVAQKQPRLEILRASPSFRLQVFEGVIFDQGRLVRDRFTAAAREEIELRQQVAAGDPDLEEKFLEVLPHVERDMREAAMDVRLKYEQMLQNAVSAGDARVILNINEFYVLKEDDIIGDAMSFGAICVDARLNDEDPFTVARGLEVTGRAQ